MFTCQVGKFCMPTFDDHPSNDHQRMLEFGLYSHLLWCLWMWACISSKDGIVRCVHGIVMGFAPTQFADLMVNKLGTVKSLPNPLHGDELSIHLHAWFCFFVYSFWIGHWIFLFSIFLSLSMVFPLFQKYMTNFVIHALVNVYGYIDEWFGIWYRHFICACNHVCM